MRRSHATPRRAGRRTRHPGQSAQALVEFSLVVPIFLTIILGVINLGVLYARQLVVDTSADVAARYAVVNSYYFNPAAYPNQSACGSSPYTACAATTIPGKAQSLVPILQIDDSNNGSAQTSAATCAASVSLPQSYVCIVYEKPSPTSATPTPCAYYDPSTGNVTAMSGYTLYAGTASATTCGGPGDLVDVKVGVKTTFIAPILTEFSASGIWQTNEVMTVIAQ